MKIIQSFAQFDDGCFHYVNGDLKGTEIYLNFYTFLLSFLTLKKYYGAVTMYCNKKAYDTFIKYIPYDEIVIKENNYTTDYWSAYKLDIISEMKEDFIHVDSDVFIFDDLFKPFIDNQDKYDLIVQDILSNKKLISWCKPVSDYIFDNIDFYNDNNICDKNIYEDKIRSFSCGVIGMNLKVRDIYLKNTMKIYDKMYNEKYTNSTVGMLLEEMTLYLTAIKNNFKWYDVLPDEEKIGYVKSDNYTHMWLKTKFVLDNILLIKNKIKFFGYEYLINDYEKSISNKDILVYKKIDNNLLTIKKYEI